MKEHTGLQVSRLYKRKNGVIEPVNGDLPRSEDPRVPQCPPEKEKAIVDALRYFGMI